MVIKGVIFDLDGTLIDTTHEIRYIFNQLLESYSLPKRSFDFFKENIGNGVAYCPHCDGPFFKGKDVAVIGGGNSGIEAALDLAGIVKSVTVFEFLPELKADKILVDQAKLRDNITMHTNVASKEIITTNGKVSAIEYQDRETEQLHQQALALSLIHI